MEPRPGQKGCPTVWMAPNRVHGILTPMPLLRPRAVHRQVSRFKKPSAGSSSGSSGPTSMRPWGDTAVTSPWRHVRQRNIEGHSGRSCASTKFPRNLIGAGRRSSPPSVRPLSRSAPTWNMSDQICTHPAESEQPKRRRYGCSRAQQDAAKQIRLKSTGSLFFEGCPSLCMLSAGLVWVPGTREPAFVGKGKIG